MIKIKKRKLIEWLPQFLIEELKRILPEEKLKSLSKKTSNFWMTQVYSGKFACYGYEFEEIGISLYFNMEKENQLEEIHKGSMVVWSREEIRKVAEKL